MVGAALLSLDIASIAISTAVPGIAWAALFALAWRRPAFAQSLGLGPRIFWLLLPGALLASFALLPIAPVTDDVLAVSLAGAGFPLAAAVLMLERVASPLRRWAMRLFAPLAVETAVLLGVVLLYDNGRLGAVARALGTSPWGATVLLVVVAAAIACALLAVAGGLSRDSGARATTGVFALTTAVLVLTFVGSQAIPGVGIADSFPYFLVPPVFAGVFAVALAPRLFPGREGLALPVAFFAGGWGVVLGADILWQPPLYGAGPAGLYAIGGAGVLDLVYLSGFLGLLGAWGTHVGLGRGSRPVVPMPATPPTSPAAQLREAYAQGVEGALGASLTASASAARDAALQAHRLLAREPANPTRPWDGLGVPGWVVSDQANLDAIARAGTTDPREAGRAYLTARALVRLGVSLGRPRFASISERLAAFGIDVAVLGGAAAVVFAGIAVATPGGLVGVVDSVAFNAAVYGFVALALGYFALSELWLGATLGKRLLKIEVRDRTLGPVGGVAAFLRNAPLLPAITLLSIGLSLAVAIAIRGVGGSATIVGVGLPAGALAVLSLGLLVCAGLGFAGAIGVATIAVTSERQRLGDVWAGTWVVRRLSAGPVPGPAPMASPRFG